MWGYTRWHSQLPACSAAGAGRTWTVLVLTTEAGYGVNETAQQSIEIRLKKEREKKKKGKFGLNEMSYLWNFDSLHSEFVVGSFNTGIMLLHRNSWKAEGWRNAWYLCVCDLNTWLHHVFTWQSYSLNSSNELHEMFATPPPFFQWKFKGN